MELTKPEDFKSKLSETSRNYLQLLQETHDKALQSNELQTERWESYKREHEELSNRLLSLRDDLSHTVMVPFGKKALMRGKMVHTNEILVCLGDGWFAKQSAKQATDICKRRIEACEEMLKKLQKEKELLMSRKVFPFENDAFGAGQTQEVIEPYDEEEEKKWRERHRQKEREYRQKLAELRKAQAQKPKIETEEDLWSRLDALDLQEELEDELNRMDEDIDEETEEESEEDDSDEDDSESEEHYKEQEEQVKEVEKHNIPKRRVSFKQDKEDEENVGEEEESDGGDNVIRIVFHHSDVQPAQHPNTSNEVMSPGDVYTEYMRQKKHRSILKPSGPPALDPSLSEDDLSALQAHVHTRETEPTETARVIPTEPVVKAVGEVVERNPSVPSVSTSERPVSRFKATRMASKS